VVHASCRREHPDAAEDSSCHTKHGMADFYNVKGDCHDAGPSVAYANGGNPAFERSKYRQTRCHDAEPSMAHANRARYVREQSKYR
jgi:hypothetical protein